jgi:hypothetical protein
LFGFCLVLFGNYVVLTKTAVKNMGRLWGKAD